MVGRRAAPASPRIATLPIAVVGVPGNRPRVPLRTVPPPFVAVSRVQVSGKPAAEPVPHPVVRHALDRFAMCVQQRDPQPHERNGARQGLDRQIACACLRVRKGARADARCRSKITLRHVGDPTDAPEHAREVECVRHAQIVRRSVSGWGSVPRSVDSRRTDLWVRHCCALLASWSRAQCGDEPAPGTSVLCLQRGAEHRSAGKRHASGEMPRGDLGGAHVRAALRGRDGRRPAVSRLATPVRGTPAGCRTGRARRPDGSRGSRRPTRRPGRRCAAGPRARPDHS